MLRLKGGAASTCDVFHFWVFFFLCFVCVGRRVDEEVGWEMDRHPENSGGTAGKG